MLKKLKQYLIKKGILSKPRRTEPELEYKMTYKGHDLYQFKSPNLLIERRRKYYTYALKRAARKLLDDDLVSLADEILTHIKANDIANLAAKAMLLKSKASMEISSNEVVTVANSIIIVDDEPLKTITEKHTLIKEELVSESQTVEDFFLRVGLNSMQATNSSSETILQMDYLKSPKQRNIENFFGREIGRDHWLRISRK